jgi:hypothetical protein
MRHIDIGGHVDIPYKKVGITGSGNATLTSRIHQISNTKSPIKAQCVAAWEHSDARAVESALHTFMEDSRVEGEWFLDIENTLVQRLQPIMSLIGAIPMQIQESEDSYTKNVIKNEIEARQKSDHILLGEISDLLDNTLRSSSRNSGPTFFSENRDLTYYVNARKSGKHHLSIGRSKGFFDEIKSFLECNSYDVEQSHKGHAKVLNIEIPVIANVINLIEKDFRETGI